LPPNKTPWAQRFPLAQIVTNGRSLPGLIEIEVTSNSHFSADTFSASLALNAGAPYGSTFWSSKQTIGVEVLFSLDALSFVTMFIGIVDTVSIDVFKGLVHITGRDLSAQLIEAHTEETFSNQTSSDIASLLASRHGLTANVVQTTTPVGRYYQDGHDRLTLGQFARSTTEWDLLVFLALQESFDISVTGTTLNFVPSNNATRITYLVTPDNCLDIKLSRHLTLARSIEVTVKSWNSRLKSGFSQTVTGVGNADPSIGGISNPQRYLFVRPNLTANQALNFAQQKLNNLTMHERVVEFVVPGDLSTTAIGQLVLTGTNTEFDQAYYIDLVERRLNLNEGFIQQIRAKSSSPRTTSTN
jgi:hypothetical protein